MKQYFLSEDSLPPKLPIIFSDSITSQIQDICDYNRGNTYGLSVLQNYLKGIINHISNRAIAFGYGSNYPMCSNGTTYIYDMGVVFCLKDDSEKVFVEVTWIDLNLEDFGLQENRNINISRIITETINNYLKRSLLSAN